MDCKEDTNDTYAVVLFVEIATKWTVKFSITTNSVASSESRNSDKVN